MTQNQCALVLLLPASFSVPAAAQHGEITGRVTDEGRHPMAATEERK